jgi:hypothetical protein
MADTGPGSVLLHGFWGDDGESDPGLLPFTMGWWDPEETTGDLEDRVAKIEAYLRAHKFLFINSNGDLEEGNFDAFTP